MSADSARKHLSAAIFDGFNILEKSQAFTATRAALSRAAAELDSDEPDQAEALAEVIAADDCLRRMLRISNEAQTALACAHAALRSNREKFQTGDSASA